MAQARNTWMSPGRVGVHLTCTPQLPEISSQCPSSPCPPLTTILLQGHGRPETLLWCSAHWLYPTPQLPTTGWRPAPSSVQPIILSWGSTLPSWLWWDSLPVSSDTSRVSFQPQAFSVGPWGNPHDCGVKLHRCCTWGLVPTVGLDFLPAFNSY